MRQNGMWPLFIHKGYPKRVAAGFLFTAIVASVVCTLVFMDGFRSYRSEADMLVLSRSEQGALETEAARDTLILLGNLENFFLRVQGEAEVLRLMAAPTGKATFRLSVESENPLDARESVRVATQVLLGEASRYYDIRNTFDFRIINISRTKVVIEHPIMLIISGVVSGIALAAVFFMIILAVARFMFSFRKGEEQLLMADISPSEKREKSEYGHAFSAETFIPKKVDAKFFSFDQNGEREKDYAHFNRGPAPMNLPIAADEDEIDALPDFLKPQKVELEKKEMEDIEESFEMPEEELAEEMPVEAPAADREPSPEEYKKRLNDLLQGKMPK